MSENEAAAGLAWGDSPYDAKTPAEVVYDYAVTRGDLSEQYARDQLARWIDRYARACVTSAFDDAADVLLVETHAKAHAEVCAHQYRSDRTSAHVALDVAEDWLRYRGRLTKPAPDAPTPPPTGPLVEPVAVAEAGGGS